MSARSFVRRQARFLTVEITPKAGNVLLLSPTADQKGNQLHDKSLIAFLFYSFQPYSNPGYVWEE